jgi:hypothetical protein
MDFLLCDFSLGYYRIYSACEAIAFVRGSSENGNALFAPMIFGGLAEYGCIGFRISSA